MSTPRLVSIIIRTLNEARHLDELLHAIAAQETDGPTGELDVEVVLVDSGSTDATLAIAERHGCNIQHIAKEQFTFGRSLNTGCRAALGEVLVFISGHCIPADRHWLARLCAPVLAEQVAYAYGRQMGAPHSRPSECRIFAEQYPARSCVPQQGHFCNNASAALSRRVWLANHFDEELTGLEDMELAKRLMEQGHRIGYVAEALILHHHDETCAQVHARFARESHALRSIDHTHRVGLARALYRITCNTLRDIWHTLGQRPSLRTLADIPLYRVSQHLGEHAGSCRAGLSCDEMSRQCHQLTIHNKEQRSEH